MYRNMMIKTVLTLMTLLPGICSPATADGDTQPNILLIINDDIGVDVSTGMYPGLIDDLIDKYGPRGHDHKDYMKIKGKPASTPTLDQFARQGMVFTNVWAHPFCSPTRASLLSGLFAAKTRVTTYADALSVNHTSFVRKLKDEAGYRTGVFGKWHIAGLPGRDGAPDYPGMKPKQAGFDIFRGNMHAAIATYWDYDYQEQDDKTAADEWRSGKPPQKSLPGIAPTTYAPVVKVADAIEWITEQEKESPDKPWFVWMAFNLSHATAIQQPSAMAVPNMDTMDAQSIAEMKACGGEFGTNNTGSCSGEALMRAMTNSMDTIIGKLLDAVDVLDSNTYVIYIGDNGTPMYARPNLDFIDNMYITKTDRGKGTAYESGARVPLAIRGPGIAADSLSNEFAHAADMYSTILELAGLTPPEQVSNSAGSGLVALDGKSLKPVLFDNADSIRDPDNDYVLSETVNLMRNSMRQVGARNASHKIICTDDTDNCVFYNLVNDPLEEYPLDKPENCNGYTEGDWTSAETNWHFCKLIEVVTNNSIF